MQNIFTPSVKRYLLSSVITFCTNFFIVFAASLNSLDATHLTFAAVSGILGVAVRGAFKSAFESALGGHNDLPSINAKPQESIAA